MLNGHIADDRFDKSAFSVSPMMARTSREVSKINGFYRSYKAILDGARAGLMAPRKAQRLFLTIAAIVRFGGRYEGRKDAWLPLGDLIADRVD